MKAPPLVGLLAALALAGEMLDHAAAARAGVLRQHGLERQGAPVPRSEVQLRLSARNSEPVIGVIEPDTETIVVDVVAGWANVLPGSLNVLPPKEGNFWVRAAELGIDSGKKN